MIHTRREPSAVVQKVKLSREARGVGSPRLLGEIGEHFPDRGSKLVRGTLHKTATRCLSRRGDEGAAVEIGLLELSRLGVENGEDLVARIMNLRDRGGEPFRGEVMA